MSDLPLDKRAVTVLGRRMAYHQRGSGAPVLFLHGNPTSSYIWRNVLPKLEGRGRLIVPDLIGMGDSDKLPNPTAETYTFAAHREHLAAFIDVVTEPGEELILVGHDWGGVLAFDWANHHRDRVRAIAYMETIVRPIAPADGSSRLRPMLLALRSDQGEGLILGEHMFVERILPELTIRGLTEEAMAEYRRPFAAPDDRWPTLTWTRQIPIAGAPADVAAIVEASAAWMAKNTLPKLFINAEPGVILTGGLREFCRTWKNQIEFTVDGLHFVQEDSGPAIGAAISDWMAANRL